MMLPLEDIKNAQAWRPTPMEERMLKGKVPPVFDDDSIISVTAIRTDEKTEVIDLSEQIPSGKIDFKVPEGDWKLVVCYRTRNRGPHRSYINMMDAKSCKVLIDTVYEPHYQHYRDDFGTTIAGFFSDEPEIGNGHLYEMGKQISELEDQAWSGEVEAELKKRWGRSFTAWLPLIWNQPCCK